MVLPFNPDTVELVFSPNWFYGIDIFFEVFSVIAALLVSYYSYKVYKFTRKRNYKWFSVSLLLIALGFLSKMFTNMVVYYPRFMEVTLGSFVITYTIMRQSDILFILGHLAHRYLMLVGFFGVYWLVSKSKEKNKIPLILFLLLATTVMSAYSYPVFSMTMVIMLSHIVYYYGVNYRKNRNSKTLLVLCSFSLLLLSQIVFIFLFLDLGVYVVSEVMQLAGYLALLYNYYLIVKSK